LTGDDALLKDQRNRFLELKEKYADLLKEFSPVVFGEGKKGAEIFMIGEAPGKREIEKGRPFVGQAGKNLDEFLEYLGIDRIDVYITNAVKFRPVKRNPDTGRLSNRAPTAKEIELFRPLLMDEIDLIDPPVIVTLGNIPLASLTGGDIKIGDVHGKASDYKGKMLYPLYHPASIIYRRGLKEVYREDLTRLKSLLKKQ
jgi:uracil-DNA glycosylase family 4